MHFAAVTILAAAALAAPASAIPTEKQDGGVWTKAVLAETDQLCFHSSLEEFAIASESPDRNDDFEWQTDGCTGGPDNPTGRANFFPACRRHDFCYHTFKKQGRFYGKTKQRVDDIFEQDLRDVCRGKGWSAWLTVGSFLNIWSAIAGAVADCNAAPTTYRTMVDTFGHLETALDVPEDGKPMIDDCSDWYTWYGKGRWTYTEVRFCFPQRTNVTGLSVFRRKSQYYWGAAWYGGQPNPATINGTLKSVEPRELRGQDFHFHAESDGDFMSTSTAALQERLLPGSYNVTLSFHQGGPYWGDDADILEVASFPILLSY